MSLRSSGIAHAATINVATSAPMGVANDGQCSLAEAIENANIENTQADCDPGSDTDTTDIIQLDAGSITLSGSLPTVTSSVDVRGVGLSQTALNAAFQTLDVSIPMPARDTALIALRDMTIQDGTLNYMGGHLIIQRVRFEVTISLPSFLSYIYQYPNGIVVYSGPALTMEDVTYDGEFCGVTANMILFTEDQQIDYQIRRVRMNGCRIQKIILTDILSGEESVAYRGGVVVEDTSIRDGAGGFIGVMLRPYYYPGGSYPGPNDRVNLTIRRTTVANNRLTVSELGGLFDGPAVPPLINGLVVYTSSYVNTLIENVTIADNDVTNQVAGPVPTQAGDTYSLHAVSGVVLYTDKQPGLYDDNIQLQPFPNDFVHNSIRLVNSTIVRNTATNVNGAQQSRSGLISRGIDTSDFPDPPTIWNQAVVAINNLLAGNASQGVSADCSDDIDLDLAFSNYLTLDTPAASLGGNIVGDGTCTGFTQSTDTLQAAGLLTSLGPLAANGGFAETMAIGPASPAYNHGVTVAGLSEDARQTTRPQNGVFDSGAYEYEGEGPTGTPQPPALIPSGSTGENSLTLPRVGSWQNLLWVIAGTLLVVMIYIVYDWRRHLKPLKDEKPDINYTLWHHVRTVTLPIFRYRLSFSFDRQVLR